MRTIHREIVAALIFSKDGKLFQGMKNPKDGGVYSDCWHIPGGGVDKNEDHLSTLVREIKAETGISIDANAAVLVDDKGIGEAKKILKETGENVLCKMNFYVYKILLATNASETNISLDDDLVKYRCSNLSDLDNLKLTPPSIELFHRLGYIK